MAKVDAALVKFSADFKKSLTALESSIAAKAPAASLTKDVEGLKAAKATLDAAVGTAPAPEYTYASNPAPRLNP
jgi:hypothetical protein